MQGEKFAYMLPVEKFANKKSSININLEFWQRMTVIINSFSGIFGRSGFWSDWRDFGTFFESSAAGG